MSQAPVAVTGVWLRTAGGEADPNRRLEVFVEVDGKWRLIQSEPTNHDGEISHITEPLGIIGSPIDYLHDAPKGVER